MLGASCLLASWLAFAGPADESPTEPETEPEAEAEPGIELVPRPEGDWGAAWDGVERPEDESPGDPVPEPRLPSYGPQLAYLSFNTGFYSSRLSLGTSRFIVPHFGIGIDVHDAIHYSARPVNEFAVAAHLWVVPFPFIVFSPYARASLGGQFFSKRLGVLGQWKGALGLLYRLGSNQRFSVRLGGEVSGSLPDDRYPHPRLRCTWTQTQCSLQFMVELGFGVRFGAW